jgi:hypothetical protein
MTARIILLAWILIVVDVASALAAEPQSERSTAASEKSSARTLFAIQRDVYAALRDEAISRKQGPNSPAVMRLVELYREMAAHPRRDESPLLAELGLKLRSRLEDVCDHIERKTARAKQPAKKQPATPRDITPASTVLAQQAGLAGGGVGQGGQPGARPGAAQPIDYGADLVDLIQRVISPGTWDINGGRGAIVYFAQQRVLVVSAPDEIHNDVSGLLGQLRAAP